MKIEKTGIRRLLIRSTNWIGDAVMTTPAVRAIRRNFPEAEITLLAKPWVMPVFSNSPDLDRHLIYPAGGSGAKLPGIIRLARDLRRRRFDAAILLQNAFEAALIAFLAGIPRRIGYQTDGRGFLLTHPVPLTKKIRGLHQTEYYLGILRGIGLETGPPEPTVTLAESDRRKAEMLLRSLGISGDERLIGINPTATFGSAKQWPIDRYGRLSDLIQRRFGGKIVLFGGPNDREIGKRVEEAMAGKAINLAGRTTLNEAMALIARLSLFITNDSGLMHVAAALDVPLIAIFGSTDPAATGPLGRKSRVVRLPVPCSPCLKPRCPEGHLDCMNRIEVETVFRQAEKLL